jgi:hypothetical protein
MELNGILLFDEMTTAVVRATTVLSPTTAEEAEEADAALDAGVDGRAPVSGDRYGELQLGIEELAVLPTVELAVLLRLHTLSMVDTAAQERRAPTSGACTQDSGSITGL